VDKCEVKRILAELGVAADGDGALGCLISELTEAILHDLHCHHGEAKTFARNRAGFWRWATSKALSHQIEHGKAWDDKSYTPLVEQPTTAVPVDVRDPVVSTPSRQQTVETIVRPAEPNTLQPSPGTFHRSSAADENKLKRTFISTAAQAPSSTRAAPFNAWITPLPVRRGKKPPPTGRTVKLSANNGLHHFKVKPRPRKLYDYTTYRHDSGSEEEYIYYDSDD
jgi:hypothetical protein